MSSRSELEKYLRPHTATVRLTEEQFAGMKQRLREHRLSFQQFFSWHVDRWLAGETHPEQAQFHELNNISR